MDDDDHFIFYGTPLPDIDDAAAALRNSNRQLQVRDDQGRQRFHGAFTGGFSAGYFNTVGSKEGWAPSSFVSSRSKGTEKIVQQPEDFMDSEDFNAFGIAPRKIHATANFQDASDPLLKQKVSSYSDSVIPGEAPLKGLIQPVSDSIGIRILMKMGWKPGQGIGPRVKKKRTIGVTDKDFVLNDPDCEEEDPNFFMFTFAPKDTFMLPYVPKDDFHGIGYVGLSTKTVLSVSAINPSSVTTKSWLNKSKKKITITGKAFGIGALEDDDDDDVYGQDDMSQYDFSDMGVSQDHKNESRTGIQKDCRGVCKVLEGFILSTRISCTKKKYPAPQLPANFRPVHKQVLTNKSTPERPQHTQKLTAEDRSLILGEKKFVSLDIPKSAPAETVKLPSIQNPPSVPIPQSTASNFKPFTRDPEKQNRYEEYLKGIQMEGKGKIVQPAATTEWEKQQELEEFARAAFLYQPMSKILGSRFVSGSHLEVDNPNVKLKDVEKEVKEQEAENKLQNRLSRTKCEWHPASLLCRRFNVPNPYPNSTSVGTLDAEKKSRSIFDSLSFKAEPLSPDQENVPEVPVSESVLEVKPSEKLSENMSLESTAAVFTSEGDKSKTEKPPMDLFKAIFQDSSSEDESSASGDGGDSQNQGNSKAENSSAAPTVDLSTEQSSVKIETPVVSRQVPKATFGVFANLDLDMLKVRKKSTLEPCDQSSHDRTDNRMDIGLSDNVMKECPAGGLKGLAEPMQSCSTSEEQFYGPRLPPPGSLSSTPQQTSKLNYSRHSKHKLKHKQHKHSKQKKSKKHKRKHSHRSDRQSSESSDVEEVDSSVIIQKLKELQSKSKKLKDC